MLIEYNIEYNKIFIENDNDEQTEQYVEKLSYKVIIPKHNFTVYCQEYGSQEYPPYHRHILFRDI